MLFKQKLGPTKRMATNNWRWPCSRAESLSIPDGVLFWERACYPINLESNRIEYEPYEGRGSYRIKIERSGIGLISGSHARQAASQPYT